MHSHSKNYRFPTMKAVYCFDVSSMVICQKPTFRSRQEKYPAHMRLSMASCIWGNGYKSVLVLMFNWQKSMQKCRPLSIFLSKHNSVTPWALARGNSTCFQRLLHVGFHFLQHRGWDPSKSLFKGFIINNLDLMLHQASTSQLSGL